MFTEPIVVTVNSVAQSMPRVQIDGSKAIYMKADESYKLTISHQTSGNRTRSMARIDFRKVVTDPLTASNDYDTLSIYTVIDRPGYGFTLAEIEQLATGFQAWLNTTAVDKLYGKEI